MRTLPKAAPCLALVLAYTGDASADVELGSALRAVADAAPLGRLVTSTAPGGVARVALLAPRGDRPRALPSNAVPITAEWFALYAAPAGFDALRAATGTKLYWSPPRRVLLDDASAWTRAAAVRADYGLSGRGVLIGLIDTGVDIRHRDLRTATGSTRVRWFVDFSRPPARRHPALENELGCSADTAPCAIFSAEDLDALLSNQRTRDEPSDEFGHGTHVASLAAGNGLSHSPPRYVGVAPEAELIVARVSNASGSGILDADVLRAARFVFERAAELSAPAVLNVSLGSDFGAHDGSSALESALSSFVGPGAPGRAIVVAAGNSGALYAPLEASAASPLGVHTAVHVPINSPVRVPLFTRGSDSTTTRATVAVWLRFQRGDRVRVGVDRDGRAWVPELSPGVGTTARDGDLEITVLNGVRDSGSDLAAENPSAIIAISGSWRADVAFGIRLSGHGSARLWVQSTGDLDPSVSSGALLPFALKEGTISVPASAPGLIAVGATMNRVSWVDHSGALATHAANGALDASPPDSVAFFSAAGPNALGVMKPDLVAPGAQVIGAMAQQADPRREPGSGLFASNGRCTEGGECFVVDDSHAVTSGSSMAAPLVAGAVALLLERDPALTQDAVRALLQAGARPLEGIAFSEQQVGVGALDIQGALAAQIASDSPLDRVPGQRSWLAFAASFVRPDERAEIEAYAELRDDEGRIADGFDTRRLNLASSGGAIRDGLTRVAPGLYRFTLSAPRNAGGAMLRVELTFDGEPLAARELPIAVDPGAALGPATPVGGCGTVPGGAHDRGLLAALFASVSAWSERRRRRQRRTK